MVGYGIEEQLPTIAVVAHYDAFGVAPVIFQAVCFLCFFLHLSKRVQNLFIFANDCLKLYQCCCLCDGSSTFH